MATGKANPSQKSGWQAKVKQLIKILEDEPKSSEFREPVDYLNLGLLDYPEIIKTPMDISTVKSKLKKGKYETQDDALADIQLIWDNCKTYNMDMSDIYKMADFMEKFAKRNAKKIGLQYKEKTKVKAKEKDDDENDDEYDDDPNRVPFDEKVRFTEKVKKVPSETLTLIVKTVEEMCPAAIVDLDSKRLQLKLDDITKDVFDKLNEILANEANKDDIEPPAKKIKTNK